jgi:sec-independent protein translocase protein TatA
VIRSLLGVSSTTRSDARYPQAPAPESARPLKEFDMVGPIGLPEMLIILLIVILLFGASRLPEIGRGLGKGIRNFKESVKEGASDHKKDDRP